MRIAAEDDRAGQALLRIAAAIERNGGFVAQDFTVHESAGDFWCSAAAGETGRTLVDYPASLTVPMAQVERADDPELLIPVAGPESLAPAQAELLAAWLDLVNGAGKLAKIRQRVPQFAVTDMAVREHLAIAGYPGMAGDPADPAGPLSTLVSWHSMRGSPGADGQPQWRLIPLKHLVNHHPDGAPQADARRPGRVTVVAGPNTGPQQTYEHYGDLDALQLLMLFGYLDDAARLVHSVPVDLPGAPGGPIRVWARAPRDPRGQVVPDVPQLSREGDRLLLRHVTIRPGNRARVRDYLAMAVRARTGATAPAAARATEALLDDIAAANLDYYDTLAELLAESCPETAADGLDEVSRTAPVAVMLRAVAALQQQRIESWWR